MLQVMGEASLETGIIGLKQAARRRLRTNEHAMATCAVVWYAMPAEPW